MSRYRIYIDETGNPDLKSSDNPNHRFLSLTGVIFDYLYVRDCLHPEMEELKRSFFNPHPDDPVIFHRKEMVNSAHPFEILKDRVVKERFDIALLEKLKSWEYTVITVLLDKKEHNLLYKDWKNDPYHYCLSLLLERYLVFLEDNDRIGDVMVESRGGREDLRIKKEFESILKCGTEYIKADRFNQRFTSRKLKVKPKKANVAGLQVADLVAHPSRRQILKDLGVSFGQGIFGDRIIEVIKEKYFVREGEIKGHGIKILP
jgi:hypothetical protein